MNLKLKSLLSSHLKLLDQSTLLVPTTI